MKARLVAGIILVALILQLGLASLLGPAEAQQAGGQVDQIGVRVLHRPQLDVQGILHTDDAISFTCACGAASVILIHRSTISARRRSSGRDRRDMVGST